MNDNSELAISDGVFQWEGDMTTNIDTLITNGNTTFATSTASGSYEDVTPEQSWTSPDATTTLYADTDELKGGYTTVWASSNDADGDGLADGVETNTGTFVDASDTGTNPHLPDTDSDGLSDGAETETITFMDATNTGANPHLADTDGDTIPDGVETGLDPNTDSTTAINLLPSTGGGLSEQDLIDLRVGSQMASIANEEATLQVVIEQSDDLGSWSTLRTESVTVPAPAGTSKQFFRYRMQD